MFSLIQAVVSLLVVCLSQKVGSIQYIEGKKRKRKEVQRKGFEPFSIFDLRNDSIRIS